MIENSLDKRNLELRMKVLDIALNLEENVNVLLILYLSIEIEERKAISHKSGNLSFKSKIDLLFDLEIFNKEEHKLFLLLMEFRNQFLHNSDCNSFTYAIQILGKDKEKNLMKFAKTQKDIAEQVYIEAYKNLYGSTLKIVREKVNKRKQIIQDKSNLFIGLTETVAYLLESYTTVYNKLYKKYLPRYSDNAEVAQIKGEMLVTFGKEIQKIYSNKKYKLLREQNANLLTPEKINLHFK